MALNAQELIALASEIATDPESLGYTGHTTAWVANKLNEPGTASLVQRVLVVSDTPVIVTGADIFGMVVTIDGLIDQNNAFGAGAAEALAWLESSNDLHAVSARYFFDAAAPIDLTHPDVRGTIDFLAGEEINVGTPPVARTLISEQAMNYILEAGMVLKSRAQELFSRAVTEADVIAALA